MLRRQLLTGLLMTIAFVVLVGVLYPLAITGLSQVFFSRQANGSFVDRGGKAVGSSLIGQSFTDAKGEPVARYFQPRPSAAGDGYDALASGGSNLGPSNKALLDSVAQRVKAYRAFNGLGPRRPVPVDAVTASASGLDPHISVANARLQAPRVARARNLPFRRVLALVAAHTQDRQLGFLGEKTVNVLDLNLALDRLG
jgi:potassium-transporting ATPase KdpC subunit